jgi:hypothetical protein
MAPSLSSWEEQGASGGEPRLRAANHGFARRGAARPGGEWRPAAHLDRGGPDAPLVVDVRQASEFEAGHVPGALPIGAGDLADRPRPTA